LIEHWYFPPPIIDRLPYPAQAMMLSSSVWNLWGMYWTAGCWTSAPETMSGSDQAHLHKSVLYARITPSLDAPNRESDLASVELRNRERSIVGDNP
jgi:hypothetical protein